MITEIKIINQENDISYEIKLNITRTTGLEKSIDFNLIEISFDLCDKNKTETVFNKIIKNSIYTIIYKTDDDWTHSLINKRCVSTCVHTLHMYDSLTLLFLHNK